MIAVWMLYGLGIGLAFVVVGHALERALHFAGRPTRWAWVIALAGSYLVPIAAWVRPEAFATFAVPIPVVVESGPLLPTSTNLTTLDQPLPSAFFLADLDRPLRWGWGVASVTLLITLILAARRLARVRRAWRQGSVDGRLVFVSRDVGPAVVGVWAPRIVLPEWALSLPESDRGLMLMHEEEHVRAADPAVLALGFGLVLLAPWHVGLWWQWRRLRLAVEADCDGRVLASGSSTAAYGELLLRVCQRRTRPLAGVPAFGESVSSLAFRIRRMFGRAPRWRWTAVVAASAVAVGGMIGACETPRPIGPTVFTASAVQLGREAVDQRSVREAERLRLWVAENARRMFPAILEPSGPAMDAYLIHDSRLHVYRGSLATMYASGKRPNAEISLRELQQALPSFSLNDGWAVVDPRGLRGLVRDNVRVIRINHDPEPQDTAASSGGVSDQEMNRRAEQVRRLARQYHPEMFGQSSQVAIALVLDSHETVVAHAARAGEARASDRVYAGVYASGESCLDVLTRLLPQYRGAQWSQSGCAVEKGTTVIVYWGQLMKP